MNFSAFLPSGRSRRQRNSPSVLRFAAGVLLTAPTSLGLAVGKVFSGIRRLSYQGLAYAGC